jgi:hypothetical protein
VSVNQIAVKAAALKLFFEYNLSDGVLGSVRDRKVNLGRTGGREQACCFTG